MFGNRALQRWVQAHAQVAGSAIVRPKLAVSDPGDRSEVEADRVADAVMRMSDVHESADPVQRQPMEEEEVQTKRGADVRLQIEEEEVERKVDDGIRRQELEEEEVAAKGTADLLAGGEVAGSTESRVRSVGSGGRPLTTQERGFFEPRIGADFGAVRVHTDSHAARAAASIGARAFTMGKHVAMGGGEYSFGSTQGKHLMAHELTHVVQNGEAG